MKFYSFDRINEYKTIYIKIKKIIIFFHYNNYKSTYALAFLKKYYLKINYKIKDNYIIINKEIRLWS